MFPCYKGDPTRNLRSWTCLCLEILTPNHKHLMGAVNTEMFFWHDLSSLLRTSGHQSSRSPPWLNLFSHIYSTWKSPYVIYCLLQKVSWDWLPLPQGPSGDKQDRKWEESFKPLEASGLPILQKLLGCHLQTFFWMLQRNPIAEVYRQFSCCVLLFLLK